MTPEKTFSRTQATNIANVEVSLPHMYPSTREAPFKLFMRLQLVKEAEDAQAAFLALSDDEQQAQMHEYDARLISLLSMKEPQGFDDFPEVDTDALNKTIYEYFMFEDGDESQREGMAYLCRVIMSKYRRTVNPSDYL